MTAEAAKEADRSPVRMRADNRVMIEGVDIHCIAPRCFDFVIFERRHSVYQFRLSEGKKRLELLNVICAVKRPFPLRPRAITASPRLDRQL